jgi:NTE family protein
MTGKIAIDVLRQALPALLGNIDDATFEAIRPHLPDQWIERAGGEVLFREGDPSDSLYLVISGRLQASVTAAEGQPRIVGEIGRGESVGEMGVFTGEPRRATITALRDTVLVRLDLTAFHEILTSSPALALNLNRVIIDRLQRRNASERRERNVTNVAVLGVSDGLSPTVALSALIAELGRQGHAVVHLTSAAVDAAAGRPAAAQASDADPDGHHWLVNYLDVLEDRNALVFYETDPTLTPWTRRCLRVADEVLLLAAAGSSPELSPVERACLAGTDAATRARQTLVVLHPASAVVPSGTARYLAPRPNVRRHFHVRPEVGKDVARLARFLSDTAVGLVLAGGGARGLSHIGVYRALEEAGVPVDSIGGTSIGGIMGGCMAMDWGWRRVYDENRGPFLSNPTRDYNWPPLVSLLSGRKLQRILDASPLDGLNIEDLWIPFFCVSSNYTQACEHVHDRGNLTRAITASMAIPGVFPPVVDGNDLLVDGGLFNNMPVDVMARTGVRTILAVDLRPQEQPVEPLGFDRVPGTWALLLDRLRGKAARRYRVPSMLTTLITTTVLNSAQKMRDVSADVDLMFHPDVSGIGMLEWRSYDKLVDVGYAHAKALLAARWPLAGARNAGD